MLNGIQTDILCKLGVVLLMVGFHLIKVLIIMRHQQQMIVILNVKVIIIGNEEHVYQIQKHFLVIQNQQQEQFGI